MLQRLSLPDSMLVVSGDFNARCSDWYGSTTDMMRVHHQLLCLLQMLSISQLVTFLTHYSQHSGHASALDLVITNQPLLLSNLSTAAPHSNYKVSETHEVLRSLPNQVSSTFLHSIHPSKPAKCGPSLASAYRLSIGSASSSLGTEPYTIYHNILWPAVRGQLCSVVRYGTDTVPANIVHCGQLLCTIL